MLEDELDRVTGLLRIQTHADVAGHRDRKIGKKPVRGIAAGNGDSRTWRQVEFAQRRGHAPPLGFAFGERVFLPGIVGWLIQPWLVWPFLGPRQKDVDWIILLLLKSFLVSGMGVK